MRRFANRIATLFSAAILAGGYLYAQTVTISPGYVNLPLGGTQQYTATVTGLIARDGDLGGHRRRRNHHSDRSLHGARRAAQELAGILISATSTANKNVSNVVYVNPEGSGPTHHRDLAEPAAGRQRHHHPHSQRHRTLYQRRHRHVQWGQPPDKVRFGHIRHGIGLRRRESRYRDLLRQ